MTYTATVSSKGQITLPAKIRRELGISAGTRVKIDSKDGALSIVSDNYEQRLKEVRKMAKKHMKANGTWGVPWEQVRGEANKMIEEELREKYATKS